MKLRATTKMAYQAAIAIAIAELMSLYFQFDRGYWITLTAMALTTQTWGESLKRSFERVGMTILGGGAGTALYFFLPKDESMLFIGLLLLFVFFAVYLMKIYHMVAVFFLTCFVVFLFALIGNWNWLLLRARIIDTMLGAVIALTVGYFFFSLKTNISDLFISHLQKMRALIATVFTASTQVRTNVSGQYLAADFRKIRSSAISIRYELLFHRLNANEFNALLNQMGLCTRYVINLTESYNWLLPHMGREDNLMVASAAKTTGQNIETLMLHLQKHNHSVMTPAANVSDLLAKAIADDPSRFATLESDALGFFSLMFFFTQLNGCLNEVYEILVKAYGCDGHQEMQDNSSPDAA